MNIISKLRNAVRNYLKGEAEKAQRAKRRQREEEIRDAFCVRRTAKGNYYITCKGVYIVPFASECRLEEIENRLSLMIDTALLCDREEN